MATDGLPDYVLDANAVTKDEGVKWRHGQPPDYTKTRLVWSESMSGSEASPRIQDEITDKPHSQEGEPCRRQSS